MEKIDKEGLLNAYTDQWFKEEIEPYVSPSKLYESTLFTGDGKIAIIDQITPYYANKWWEKRQILEKILEEYIIND